MKDIVDETPLETEPSNAEELTAQKVQAPSAAENELPRTIKAGSFWLVIYEHRPAVITISADGHGFFACGQEELWPMREVKAWIREIRVVNSEPHKERTGEK